MVCVKLPLSVTREGAIVNPDHHFRAMKYTPKIATTPNNIHSEGYWSRLRRDIASGEYTNYFPYTAKELKERSAELDRFRQELEQAERRHKR